MHRHRHHRDESSARIGWAFVLNAGFTVIEFIGGLLTNSTAIMADAVHDLGDTLSIASAWLLSRLAARDPNEVFTYGYRRLSLFGALLNGLVLIAGSLWVLWQALPRLLDPVMPEAGGMLGLALFGVAVNGFAAWKLSKGKSMNERVLNWHLLEDVFGWLAVLIVSLLLMLVDWPILDPLLALLFTLFILVNVFRHSWTTLSLFFQAVPEAGLREEIHRSLLALPEVGDIHHEHFWSLDGEHHVYTAHLSLRQNLGLREQTRLKEAIADRLAVYNLAHTTIELELPDEFCRDEPDDEQAPIM